MTEHAWIPTDGLGFPEAARRYERIEVKRRDGSTGFRSPSEDERDFLVLWVEEETKYESDRIAWRPAQEQAAQKVEKAAEPAIDVAIARTFPNHAMRQRDQAGAAAQLARREQAQRQAALGRAMVHVAEEWTPECNLLRLARLPFGE